MDTTISASPLALLHEECVPDANPVPSTAEMPSLITASNKKQAIFIHEISKVKQMSCLITEENSPIIKATWLPVL